MSIKFIENWMRFLDNHLQFPNTDAIFQGILNFFTFFPLLQGRARSCGPSVQWRAEERASIACFAIWRP